MRMPALWVVWISSILIANGSAQNIGRVDPVGAADRSVSVKNGDVYWSAPSPGSINALGEVLTFAKGNQQIRLLQVNIRGKAQKLLCKAAVWNPAGTELKINYLMNNQTLQVTVKLGRTATGLTVAIDGDVPEIEAVDFGGWSSDLRAQTIPVPYYTGSIWYSSALSQYMSAWWDWQTTQATKLDGTTAEYLATTGGSRNLLHERLNIVVSPDVDAALPMLPNPPSPYTAELAGRMVLDIWDAGFSGIRAGLAELADYGIGDCVGIIHDWQYAGFDDGLPQHFPANDKLGGNVGLEAAVAQGKAGGCLMAVHENYIDYYPDYPKFTPAAIALNSDDSKMNSWLRTEKIPDNIDSKAFALPNHWTTLSNKPGFIGIQSFSTKPAWMLINASTQSPTIHEALGTTAAYLDVHSSASISSHGDMDATSQGAGLLTRWMSANQSLWAYERKVDNGPVFGEGMNHWYYSGMLDGVEAQTGAGSVPKNDDARIPLFVDFDLLRIHPLQVNHGMGYYERWTASSASNMTTAQTDAYRMQELAFGHAPFLSRGTWNDVSRAFVESNLVSPVAKAYGTAQVRSIQYETKGAWASPSVAAPGGNFGRVKIVYGNGLTLVANSLPDRLIWDKLALPQYGWVAKGPGVFAYSAFCGNSLCDYAETGTSLFANARNESDAKIGSAIAAPSVTSVKQGAGNSIAITYNWKVYRSPGQQASLTVFVHFIRDDNGGSSVSAPAFHGDHRPAQATTQWSAGQSINDGPWTVSIPPSVQNGTYSILVGLYDQSTGTRINLAGNNDGTNRYSIGHLEISGQGTKVSFTPASSQSDPRLNAAGTVVDFGGIRTDGMVSLTQLNGRWLLRPFPRYRNFTILLNATRFPMPSSVVAAGDKNTTVVPNTRGSYWQLPLNGSKTYSWPIRN